MVVEILHLTVFKMASVFHLGFLNFKILVAISLGEPMYITVPNFIKIGQAIADILLLTVSWHLGLKMNF